MATEPDHIRARVQALLADSSAEPGSGLEEITHRLEEVHELLVHALESVEKG